MPVRLKAIHVLNCVWFFDKVLTLIKPFMKKELLDIVSIAGVVVTRAGDNVCHDVRFFYSLLLGGLNG